MMDSEWNLSPKDRNRRYFIARRFRAPAAIGRSRTNDCRPRGMSFGSYCLNLPLSLIDSLGCVSVYTISFGPNVRGKMGGHHPVIWLGCFCLTLFCFGPSTRREKRLQVVAYCVRIVDVHQVFLSFWVGPSSCRRYMLGRLSASYIVVVAVQLRSTARVPSLLRSLPFLCFVYWVLCCLTLRCRPAVSPTSCPHHGLLCCGGSSCSGAYWFSDAFDLALFFHLVPSSFFSSSLFYTAEPAKNDCNCPFPVAGSSTPFSFTAPSTDHLPIACKFLKSSVCVYILIIAILTVYGIRGW